jgi:hypothetical protein
MCVQESLKVTDGLLGVGNNGAIFRKFGQPYIPHGSSDSLDPCGMCREPFVALRVVQNLRALYDERVRYSCNGSGSDA